MAKQVKYPVSELIEKLKTCEFELSTYQEAGSYTNQRHIYITDRDATIEILVEKHLLFQDKKRADYTEKRQFSIWEILTRPYIGVIWETEPGQNPRSPAIDKRKYIRTLNNSEARTLYHHLNDLFKDLEE